MVESGMLLLSHVSVKTETQHRTAQHCLLGRSQKVYIVQFAVQGAYIGEYNGQYGRLV